MTRRARWGEVRIPRGELRGRKLRFRDRPGLRPTPARTQEALFSILGDRSETHGFIDAFAGSGVVGVTAASVGFQPVILIERELATARALQATVDDLGLSVEVLQGDALHLLDGIQLDRPVVVYADPPFDGPLVDLPLQASCRNAFGKGLVMVFEHDRRRAIEVDAEMDLIKTKGYGRVCLTILSLGPAPF